MRAIKEVDVIYRIELREYEAVYLKGLLQNYLCSETGANRDKEDPEIEKIREELFDGFKGLIDD